jgi:hypothetical protein
MLYKIKKDLDKLYGFDISTKLRSRKYAYARKVFCKLARLRIEQYTLTEIGNALNIQHDNVIYNLNTFNYIGKSDVLIFNKLSNKYLGTDLPEKPKEIETPKDIKNDIIHLNAFNELLELNDVDILEFIETRLKPFLMMLETRKLHKKIDYVPGAIILR